MFENLTNNNIELFAIKCYDSPNAIKSEFENDFRHIKYIKKLLRKYKSSKGIKERLILNHIICLANVFGVRETSRILFFYLEEKDYCVLKTFLLFLSYLPDVVYGIKGRNINTKSYEIDKELLVKLQEI